MQNEDETRVRKEEDNYEIGVIEGQSELAFEDVVVQSDGDEKIAVWVMRDVLMMEKKAMISAKIYFFCVNEHLHSEEVWEPRLRSSISKGICYLSEASRYVYYQK